MFLVMCGSFICGLGLEIFTFKGWKKQKKGVLAFTLLGGLCLIAFAVWLAWPK